MKNIFKLIFIFLFFLTALSANAFGANFIQIQNSANEAFIESVKHETIFEINKNNTSVVLSDLRNERISQSSNFKNNQNSSNDKINNQNKNNKLALNSYTGDSVLKFFNIAISQIENTIYARAP